MTLNSFIKHDVGLPCVYFLIICFYIFLFNFFVEYMYVNKMYILNTSSDREVTCMSVDGHLILVHKLLIVAVYTEILTVVKLSGN